LLNELRESLEEQTATSEVLKVISSSAGDLEPVFDAMLEKAVRICDASFGAIYNWDGASYFSPRPTIRNLLLPWSYANMDPVAPTRRVLSPTW
jgi:hypothetical protein